MSGFKIVQTLDDFYHDPRTHGYQGPTRNVRLPRACSNGGGAISKSQDGTRCVVAGNESLKILRITDASQPNDFEDSAQYKTSAAGTSGFRVEASKNLWEGSGLKTLDSTSTGVAWCRDEYKNKILTSARNGELMMWDINKSGSKYERRTKDHSRSIHALSVSPVVANYCITGSSDGDLRVWDLRQFNKSILRVHHPTGIRGVAFSPVVWSPLQVIVGLENGSIYRWDLKMGQRGQLDRIPVAHTASVTSLDWCSTSTATTASGGATSESTGNGLGWVVSGGLDRCVKVWNLTSLNSGASSHIPHKPTYTLHPSFQVRRVLWRPSHECEIAMISNGEFGSGSNPDMNTAAPSVSALPNSAAASTGPTSAKNTSGQHGEAGVFTRIGSGLGLGLDLLGAGEHPGQQNNKKGTSTGSTKAFLVNNSGVGDAAEIWDVRRGWIAKWNITGSATEGGLTDIVFADSHSVWSQHSSGTFSQIDLRDATRPLDAINNVSLTPEPSGALTFVTSLTSRWDVPYDDIRPEVLQDVSKAGIDQKGIGDPEFQNNSQVLGRFAGLESDSHGAFVQLARNYVIEGLDRQAICNSNAQVASQVGHYEATQLWLQVAASLAKLVPDTPTRRSLTQRANSIGHSVSAPAVVSRGFSVDSRSSPGGKSPRGLDNTLSIYNNKMYTRSLSTTSAQRRRTTPASSNQSSPHQGLTALPPVTPMIARLPSFLGRRESIDSGIASPQALSPGGSGMSRRSSLYRRPSTTYSASPSSSSLKHVGEGALDDSDSSSSSESGNHIGRSGDGFFQEINNRSQKPALIVPFSTVETDSGSVSSLASRRSCRMSSCMQTRRASISIEGCKIRSWFPADGSLDRSNLIPLGFFDDEESDLHKSLISPALAAARIAHPSPLSRVVGQHRWTEDEDGKDDEDEDEASPSPRSTDSEASDDANANTQRLEGWPSRRPIRRNSSAAAAAKKATKPRSRSSTLQAQIPSMVGSNNGLSASSYSKPPLTRHDSHSSIRTVTIGGDRAEQTRLSSLKPEETIKELRNLSVRNREKSLAASDLIKPRPDEHMLWTEREDDAVEREEKTMTRVAWAVVRERFEEMANDGDLQMCAMLAILVPRELAIGKRRRLIFIENYIERLTRLQLFVSASYLRKHTAVEEIQYPTLVDTTIYTACGRCGKAIAITPKQASSGDYSFCSTCKIAIACTICRLPVRGLMFQCSVCSHGGHQLCYRRYYVQRPMIPHVPPNLSWQQPSKARGRSVTRSNASTLDDDEGSTTSAISAQDTSTSGSSASDAEPIEALRPQFSAHQCVVPHCRHHCWLVSDEDIA